MSTSQLTGLPWHNGKQYANLCYKIGGRLDIVDHTNTLFVLSIHNFLGILSTTAQTPVSQYVLSPQIYEKIGRRAVQSTHSKEPRNKILDNENTSPTCLTYMVQSRTILEYFQTMFLLLPTDTILLLPLDPSSNICSSTSRLDYIPP